MLLLPKGVVDEDADAVPSWLVCICVVGFSFQTILKKGKIKILTSDGERVRF